MPIIAFARSGFGGELVTVEVDIRRGIPGVDIVGLPDGAVREAKERIRAAIRNSGYEFPADRVLVNLAPASVRKEGASFDLPIAMAILLASGQAHEGITGPVLVVGELELSGRVRPVNGVLSALSRAREGGVADYVVPRENLEEALSLEEGRVVSVSRLADCVEAVAGILPAASVADSTSSLSRALSDPVGFMDGWERGAMEGFFSLRWPLALERGLLAAAAGGHNVLLAGPPGAGKTMAGKRFVSLLPDLSRDQAVEATRIHSLAGLLPDGGGLLTRPPFRSPHHSASAEGMVGGGKVLKPGEISLAHRGVLFLDEAPEFDRSILQALREPIEEGRITLSRANGQARFPADFQLILAANPCPCGNLGRKSAACLCSLQEVERYWRRLGGALLDRIDVRIQVMPMDPALLLADRDDRGRQGIESLLRAYCAQAERYRGQGFRRNAKLPPESIRDACRVDARTAESFARECERRSLSTRASHSALRLARSLADLDGCADMGIRHLEEAFSLRAFESRGPSEWFG
jgi:magnesium chelatase family protein